jgi:hypothetical protein
VSSLCRLCVVTVITTAVFSYVLMFSVAKSQLSHRRDSYLHPNIASSHPKSTEGWCGQNQTLGTRCLHGYRTCTDQPSENKELALLESLSMKSQKSVIDARHRSQFDSILSSV